MPYNFKHSEIEHFSNQAEEWWNPNGPLKTLHHINPIRVQYVERFIQKLSSSKTSPISILDVGCGGGILTEALANHHHDVTGIDAALDLINIAKLHAQKGSLSYEHNTIEQFYLDHPNQQFDITVSMEMLEHVPNPQSIIDHMAKLTKPDGYMILSTLNRTLKSFLGAIIAAEYLFNLIPKGTHQYENFLRPHELKTMIENTDAKPIDIQGIQYNPLTQTATFSNQPDINYFICAKV